jgi:hypothetical protein
MTSVSDLPVTAVMPPRFRASNRGADFAQLTVDEISPDGIRRVIRPPNSQPSARAWLDDEPPSRRRMPTA